MQPQPDVLIFGGGGAGLWLLDELRRRGYDALLAERFALGAGQTVASQGILHGGIKYTLSGLFSESARTIRDMPGIWRDCLAGRGEPDLSGTRVASESCHLWGTQTTRSRLGLAGARHGLRSDTAKVSAADRPKLLASCRGDVYRVDEQVIDVVGLLHTFARLHADRLLAIETDSDVEFDTSGPGQLNGVTLTAPNVAQRLTLQPRQVVLTAGAGNADLCARAGLSEPLMQRRPLHMVMVRGRLPELFGHCVDGAHTRVTVTSSSDAKGRTVWQVGGQVAEDGVAMSADDLIRRARNELATVLPGVDLSGTEWAAYRVDRAEGITHGGARPAGPCVTRRGNVVVAWPTKLVLVPRLAKLIVDQLDPPAAAGADQTTIPADWPRPEVAAPPWETSESWHCLDST
ncbi:MAG: FAD-dependent oxidoreductase [bacterium]|nr:FAD-dependent oxidoreductase [bacterium]